MNDINKMQDEISKGYLTVTNDNIKDYYTYNPFRSHEDSQMQQDKYFLQQLVRFYIDDEAKLEKSQKLIQSINDKEALILTRELIKEEIRQHLVKTNE